MYKGRPDLRLINFLLSVSPFSKINKPEYIKSINNKIRLSNIPKSFSDKVLDIYIDHINTDMFTPVGRRFHSIMTKESISQGQCFLQSISPKKHLKNPPLFVVGLPRSGTTNLHNMIINEFGYDAFKYWELASPKNISTIFPHQRIIGPMTMPFSIQTLQSINLLKEKLNKNVKKDLTFVGSLYEPRTTILKEINTELVKKNIKINMVWRELGSKKTTDEKYWLKLLDSKMIITTSNQIENNKTDWANINHLVYRYLEVPLCGSVLIAQKVPALEKYFQEDIHYISYENSQEAVKKIIYYLDNKEELIKIAHKGHEKAVSIVNSNLYWNIVDSSLRKYSLI